MSHEMNSVYHEVEFLLPVHRFNIRFSYVTKKGLPFIREFVLRLIHVSPMMPVDIASYFGLAKREADEAISDLVDKGDLQFLDSGQIDLTSKSSGYFVGLGSIPHVSTLMESGGAFAFELASFNCVGRNRTNENWVPGLRLEVPNETIANSERMAKRKFQQNFYKIQEQGFWEHKSDENEPGRPSIYTMESVRKLGQEPLRLISKFAVDAEGMQVERADFDVLEDSSTVQELVTDAIASAQKPTNFEEIARAMDILEDRETRSLFNDNSIDVSRLMLDQQAGPLNGSSWVPFLGPVYSKDNWALIDRHMEEKRSLLEKNNDSPPDLLWLAPSDGFWGQSSRTSACLDELIDQAVTKGKKAVRRYTPKLLVPLQDARDRQGINRWKQQFPNQKSHVSGLVEGFMDGNVEVLLLSDHLAVVSYHISKPESFPVTLPVGYITADKQKVKLITALVTEYVGGVVSFDNPRNLGKIAEL
jgi:hypothetical protein